MVVAVGSVGCSADQQGAPPGSVGGDGPVGGSSVPAPASTTQEGTLPSPVTTGPPVNPSTTIVVSVPPIPSQASASGREPSAAGAADRINACVPTRTCSEVDAPLVAWPGGELSQQDFGFAVLSGADFRGADLSGVNFTGADLSGANFSGAKLDGANLASADLSGAFLVGARLRGVDLRGANLYQAVSDGADFEAATFCDTAWVDGRVLNDDC